jgi:hypothetical protein
MILTDVQLTVGLIPHCTSVTREGWTGSLAVIPHDPVPV